MKIHRATLLFLPLFLVQYSPLSLAAEETENWLRLQRLNQQSQLQLERMRQPPTFTRPLSHQQARQQLHAQQQSGLSRLQERQRRNLMAETHRRRILNDAISEPSRQRLQLLQMRNRQEQRYLLNRYRRQMEQYPFAQ
jgi:hypothetical protein